jgi:hypothetical protein
MEGVRHDPLPGNPLVSYPGHMGSRARALIATMLVVAVPAITVRLLHGLADRPWFQIDYRDLGGWLGRTNLVDALTAAARLAALVLAYYLLVSTVLYLIALTSGNRSLIRITGPFAIPMVRSLADRVIAGSIALSTVATPLIASSPPTPGAAATPALTAEVSPDYVPPSRLIQGIESEHSAREAADAAAGFSGRPTTAPPPPIATEDTDGAEPVGPIEVEVESGDHLWGLAVSRIADVLGRIPLEHEVAPYWREIVDENRTRIRSGNPDVIFPGEVIVLPDPTPHVASS